MRKAVLTLVLLLASGCATNRTLPPALPPEPPSDAAVPEATVPATSDRTFSLFPQLKRDAVHIGTAPLRWQGADWVKFGLGVAAVGGAILLDEDLREIVNRNNTGAVRKAAKAVSPFGSEYSFGTIGAFYLAGKLLKDEKAMTVAEDGVASSLIAAGVISPILKSTIGRRRPSQTASTFSRDGGGVSFPSGHTTQAFAIASVIAAHYSSFWVQAAAYGIAGLVGLSRMEQGAHYASDVLAGALIGVAVGNAVVRLHDSKRFHLSVVPAVNPRSRGVALLLSIR